MEDNKYAIICKSNKSKTGLPVKSLTEEIKQLKKEGYTIINNLSNNEE